LICSSLLVDRVGFEEIGRYPISNTGKQVYSGQTAKGIIYMVIYLHYVCVNISSAETGQLQEFEGKLKLLDLPTCNDKVILMKSTVSIKKYDF